jgi:hypothetical protein
LRLSALSPSATRSRFTAAFSPLVEILDECLGRPQGSAQLFTRDELARPFKQPLQHVEWLLAQGEANSVPAQFG